MHFGKSRTTRHDLLPIYLCVTIDSKRFGISANLHVRPLEWSPAGGKVRRRSDSANDINTSLDLIRSRIYEYRKSILDEGREFNITTLHEKWYGQDRKKTFERHFIKQVGVSPKLFCCGTRFNHALALKLKKPESDWRTIGLESGYFNSMHLIRDFKRFSWNAPPVFFNQTPLTGEH